jgi:DNA-directed RNA polymerase subunit RPC12/RpoP
MKEIEHLKYSCIGCGQTIEYLPDAAGQIVACPKCTEKNQLPSPDSRPDFVESCSPDELDQPPPTPCPICGAPPNPKDHTCPACETRHQKKLTTLVWASVSAVGLFVIVSILLVVCNWFHPLSGSVADNATNSTNRVLAHPTVHPPKSLEDLKVGSFVLEKPGSDNLRIAVGDIENVSENLHLRVKVDLDVLDAQGAKIGALTHTITELRAHFIWHVLVSTTNTNAASVRFAGISEGQ